MDYTTFIKTMHLKLTEQMKPEVTVEVYQTVKNNGVIRSGLVFAQAGVNVSPTIYLEEFYEQYLRGEDIGTLLQSIQDIYHNVKIQQPFPYANFLEYSKLKDRIVYKVINYEENKDLLEELPYMRYLDLAIVFMAFLEESEIGTVSLLIRREHVDQWNINVDTLMELASKNTERIFGMEFEVLMDCVYVLTNKFYRFGAGTMLYRDVWERISAIIEENFYVIPSSVHELILIPESYGMNKISIEEMVREINKNEVEKEDVLSNRVYYYSILEEELFM